MKAVVGVVLMLALVACAAQASDVVVLTNDNFDEVLNNNAFVLVEFFVRTSMQSFTAHLYVMLPCLPTPRQRQKEGWSCVTRRFWLRFIF